MSAEAFKARTTWYEWYDKEEFQQPRSLYDPAVLSEEEAVIGIRALTASTRDHAQLTGSQLIENNADLLEKARYVHGQLQEAVRQLASEERRSQMQSQWRWRTGVADAIEPWHRLNEAINNAGRGNFLALDRRGMSINPAWLHDVVRGMLKNRLVDVHVAETRQLPAKEVNSPEACSLKTIYGRQQAGLKFAALLRNVDGLETTRPVVQVDDLLESHQFPVNAVERWRMLQAARLGLQETEVVDGESEPGKEFRLVSYQESTLLLDALLARLDQSSTGLVVPYSDGRIFFRPYERIYRSVGQQYAKGDKAFYHNGVMLQDEHTRPTSVAIKAASYLHDPFNLAHLRLQSTSIHRNTGVLEKRVTDSRELSTMLQALDLVYPDRDQTVYYDSQRLPEAYIVYALTHLLCNEVGKVIQSLEELDDVRVAMKPRDYFMHNYNSAKGVWPEDIQGIRVIGDEMPLNYDPGEISSAAVIGYGPFSYPALAIAPFMREGSEISISDLLPENINFAKEWFDGRADKQHEEVYRRFGDCFRENPQSGDLYADCESQLRKFGRLYVASLEDLPTDSAQLVVESFVSCSNNIEKWGFYTSIKQKARVLKWSNKSMMVSVHMVGSGGWNNSGDDEGIKIPAARLSLEEIEDGYSSAGLRIVKYMPLHADANLREDYKGMAVVFAKPDTRKRLHSIPMTGSVRC